MLERVKPSISLIDLVPITRESGACLTTVTICYGLGPQDQIEWIRAGQVSLRKNRESEPGSSYDLTSYVRDGATDHEHDSAYALSLPLIGLTFVGLSYQQTEFEAWINPNLDVQEDDGSMHGGVRDQFHVPDPGYNPFKGPKSGKCKDCKGEDAHYFAPYLPPNNVALYRKVRGMRVRIYIGPVPASGTGRPKDDC